MVLEDRGVSMELIFVTGPALAGKTNYVLSELLDHHNNDPFSYLFVGPTGDYIRHIREIFLNKASCIFSERFLPLDQFAVRVYKNAFKDALHIGSHVSTTIICEILRSMNREDLASSSYMVDYLQEMIRDVKENGGSFYNIFSEEDDKAILLLEAVYKAFTEYAAGHGMFDTFDAYLSAGSACKSIAPGAFGDTAFIDGFHDFSPAMSVFLESVLDKFNTVFLTCPKDRSREDLFSSSKSITKFVTALSQKARLKTVELDRINNPVRLTGFFKNLFNEENRVRSSSSVEVCRYDNVYTEVDAVCRKTKALLKAGFQPEDIALVSADFLRYSELVSSRLTEYGVPYRVEGDRPLIESFSVRSLVLPLEIAATGFPPEAFLALIEQGYAGQVDLRFCEMIFSSARLLFGIPRGSLKHRSDVFFRKIGNYKELLKSKVDALRASAEDDFDENTARTHEDTLKLLESEFEPAIESLFDLLEPFGSMARNTAESFAGQITKNFERLDFKKRMEALNTELEDDSENAAVSRLLEEVLPELSSLLRFMGKDRLSPADYFGYLKVHLKNRTYKSSTSVGNRVEIQSLMGSRFSSKKIKLFLGFVEGSYPDVRINPLYASSQYGNRPRDFLLTKEKQQKLNLYLSITRCTEAVIFTLPESTIDGLPILHSPYLKEIQESGAAITAETEDTSTLRRMKLAEPMSPEELSVSIAYAYGKSGSTRLFDKHDMPDLKADLEEFIRPYSWEVLDKAPVEKTVGKTFSFTRLKSYSDCPFRFFLDYVLKLPRPEEVSIELSPMEEGAVFHAVLKDYYSGSHMPWEESLSVQLAKHLRHDSKLVREIEYRRLHAVLEDYILRRNKKMPKNWTENFIPSFFEISFGMEGGPRVPLAGGLFLRGKIDRIDLNESTKELFIIDYKRGQSAEKEQLVLYAIAAERVFSSQEYRVTGGTFKALTGKTVNMANFSVKVEDDLPTWCFAQTKITHDGLEKWLSEISSGIAEGKFSPQPALSSPSCYRCNQKSICQTYQWLPLRDLSPEGSGSSNTNDQKEFW